MCFPLLHRVEFTNRKRPVFFHHDNARLSTRNERVWLGIVHEESPQISTCIGLIKNFLANVRLTSRGSLL